MLESVFQDLRQSVRSLRRSPSFTVAAVLVLAIGLGANMATFAVVDSVLLRPLSYAAPERLYAVKEIIPEFAAKYPELPANGRHFLEWQRSCACFDGVVMSDTGQWNLTGDGEAQRVPAARVTSNFFSVLGVSVRLGRVFVVGEETNDDRVVVLSDALWHSRFGASPDVLGQSIEIDGVPNVIVGVLPPSFRYRFPGKPGASSQERVDIYKPWRIAEQAIDWVGSHNYASVARLAPGKTMQQAQAEFAALQAQIAKHFDGPNSSLSLSGKLIPLKEELVGRSSAGVLLLLAAVGTVLLIACLNLGNLMLLRALARGREMAIRVALGAGRGRIFRGALVESLLLASVGAALGVVLAFNLVRILAAIAPASLPRADEIAIETPTLVFAVVVAIASAIVFGLVPAMRAARASPQPALRGTGRAAVEGGRSRPREWLVAAETGLSVALSIVAGLLIVSFVRLDAVERGYDAQNVLTAELTLPAGRYPDEAARLRFYDELASRLHAQPGVVAAGVSSVLPLRGEAWNDVVTIEGDERSLDQRPIIAYRTVSSDYFAAIGTSLREGRVIEASDYPRRVAVVSATAAKQLWPGQDPVGKRFRRVSPADTPFEVVGVANDVRSAGLEVAPPPIVYVSLWERPPPVGSIVIRTRADRSGGAATLRATVVSIDADVPLSRIDTMADVERSSTALRRFQTLLVIGFAASALALAAVGIYGVVGHSTARRTNEIGLRMALGATGPRVRAMVVRDGLRPVAIGLAAGIASALAVGRLVSALLFEVAPADPATFVTVACLVAAVGLLACWLPARRAARLAPLDALRHE